jgi:hypothetical protein
MIKAAVCTLLRPWDAAAFVELGSLLGLIIGLNNSGDKHTRGHLPAVCIQVFICEEVQEAILSHTLEHHRRRQSDDLITGAEHIRPVSNLR